MAELASKLARVVTSPYVSTPPTVNNEDAESVVPLDESTAKGSPAPSAHGGSYPGQPAPMMHLQDHMQAYSETPMMTALYEQNGAMHPLPVSLAVRLLAVDLSAPLSAAHGCDAAAACTSWMSHGV